MPLRKVGQIRPREDASPVTPEEPAPQRQREDDLIDLTSSDEELDEALSQIPLARPNDGLTDQQRDVVRAAKAPDDIPPGGEIIRVTAAAGTGKTTTLEHVARRLLQDLGHRKVTYLVFNKAAQAEAQNRLHGNVVCRTLHAQAYRLMSFDEENGNGKVSLKPEEEMPKYVLETFRNDINRFYERVPKDLVKYNARRRCAFFIWKTVVRFMQSADDEIEGFEHWRFGKCYYPAVLHAKGSPGAKEKRLPNEPEEKEATKFYCECAERLWRKMRVDFNGTGLSECGFWTYDGVMKQVQLEDCEVPTRTILVDESQDCTPCQITWIEDQRARGKQIFFVGDSAQTIYSFRGAKSMHLAGMNGITRDFQLTNSFRFGPNIAAVANTILFGKMNSPQGHTFTHYSVVGGNPNPGTVSRSSEDVTEAIETLLARAREEGEKEPSVTLLAWKNVSLIVAALKYLSAKEDARIAIYGNDAGGRGGKKETWAKACKEVELIFKMYQEPNVQHEMPYYEFLDDKGQHERFTYAEFKSVVDARELGKYNVHVGLIEAYGSATMTKVKAFKERVLRAKVDPARCDVILSTVNQAKGAEWSNVLVLDDLATLAAFNADADGLNRKRGHRPTKPAPFAEFQWKEYGDDFNLWYVACTRAKRRLAVPAAYFDVEESFEEARRVATNEGVEEEEDKAEAFVEVEEEEDLTFIPPRQLAAKRRVYTAEQVARIHALGVEKDRFLSEGL